MSVLESGELEGTDEKWSTCGYSWAHLGSEEFGP